MGRSATVKLYDTQTAAYADLQAGRLDAIVSDVYPAFDWLTKNTDYEFVGEKVDIKDLIGIAIRKGEDDLKGKFNAALKAIREDGTYAAINKKYFPTPQDAQSFFQRASRLYDHAMMLEGYSEHRQLPYHAEPRQLPVPQRQLPAPQRQLPGPRTVAGLPGGPGTDGSI